MTNKPQCKQQVWHGWGYPRCSRRAVRGDFCVQHSPEAVKERKAKREAKDKKDRERFHAPYKRIEELEEKIKHLESALPVWTTLDPQNKKTWPVDGEECLVITRDIREFAEWQEGGHGFDVFSCDGWIAMNSGIIKYRPLCDLDNPPE